MIEEQDYLAKQNLHKLSDIGEFGWIDFLKQNQGKLHDFVNEGIGDDAAVLTFPESSKVVWSSDMLVEGIHFDLSYTPLKYLGYKSIAVNVSDICAMYSTPIAVLVSIAVSNRFSLEALNELYQGVNLACEEYKISLIGGDTTSSRAGLMISISIIGYNDTNDIVKRSGASVNDLICVTGDLGAAYAGLQLLQREKKVFEENPTVQPDLSSFEYVVGRQLRPTAKLGLINILKEKGLIPSAMIDISDGLGSELHHLCKANSFGAKIFSDRLPIDFQTKSVAELFYTDVAQYAIYGGEDYELLFTVNPKYFEEIKSIEGISIIGYTVNEELGIVIETKAGDEIEIKNSGWDSFI